MWLSIYLCRWIFAFAGVFVCPNRNKQNSLNWNSQNHHLDISLMADTYEIIPSDSITLPLAHSSSLYFRPDSSSTHRGTSSSGGDHRISPSKSASLGRPSRPRTAPPNRASSKSSRSESAHPVSDTGAIKRQDTVDARKSQQQLSTTSALGKHRIIKFILNIGKFRKKKSTNFGKKSKNFMFPIC